MFIQKSIDQIEIEVQIEPRNKEINDLGKEEADNLQDINYECMAFRRQVKKIKAQADGEQIEDDDEDDY